MKYQNITYKDIARGGSVKYAGPQDANTCYTIAGKHGM